MADASPRARAAMLVTEHRRPIQTVIATRLRTDLPLALLDAVVVVLAYLVPLVLRFEGEVPPGYWRSFWGFASIAVALHLLANYALGLYGQVWRYASVQEARRILLASVLAGGLVFTTGLWMGRPVPLSVLGLGALLSLAGFGAIRFQSRLFALHRRSVVPPDRARTIIVGAGEAGANIARDILRHPECGLFPVAFLDDDRRKHGLSIQAIPVAGGLDVLGLALGRLRVEQALVAIPTAPSEVYRTVLDVCEEAQIPVRVLPTLDKLVNGHPTIRDIRDIRIEDLVGRKQVQTDLEAVRTLLHGKRVLVTGAGGSIGSEIAKQVAAIHPSVLILLDHDETHLHDLLTDLDVDGLRIVPALADIRDRNRILSLFARERPDVVFHAAAHKHVPLLEEHPDEAVRTNVLGTANVAEGALACDASRFILISTDKAIRPVSVMGMTKKLSEDVVISLDGAGCRFSAVRFGNVLGSRGSVVPTFLRQIERGGPVTVTDPRMTRYFMSIAEAVQLVLQAAALATGGDVFTLDMGDPVNMLELARRMIRLSGKTPDRDIRITITGIRPGERLTESIHAPAEPLERSEHPNIFRSVPPAPNPAAVRRSLAQLGRLCEHAGAGDLRRALLGDAPGVSLRQTDGARGTEADDVPVIRQVDLVVGGARGPR